MVQATAIKSTFIVQHKSEPTCSQCREYDRGLCRLKAAADWGDSSFVKADKKACFLADLLPF
ncbi:MAG: hypothetical protein KME10_11755 [Plectolyngbya sp. WJT66-NPBG17]|jgi:hypothetical protein|nr:hypothetical protein [Plectolyngbya sp. WJT66-NPBG17]